MDNRKILDVLVLGLFLILAPIVSFYFKTSLLVSVLLFYFPPAIWLSWRKPSVVKKAAIFSLIGTAIFFMADYIAISDGAWFIQSSFDYHMFGIIPLENSLWLFIACYLTVLFYEYFDDKSPRESISPRIKSLAIILIVLMFAFFSAFIIKPDLLVLSYAFAWIALIFCVVPIITILIGYPRLILKFLKTNFYILCLHLPFEIVALKTGQWNFPGSHFVGWVDYFRVSFPIEELFVFVIMTGFIFLSYYEFFVDDQS